MKGIILKMSTLQDFKKKQSEEWKTLKEAVGGAAGDELVSAMQDLYSIYDEKIIDWFAGLYDVKRGAYYYASSARDNEEVVHKDKTYKLLPDIESTHQALRFVNGSGLVAERGGSYATALPEWMRNDILKFAMSLQDENGFFYHEQWGKEYTDKMLSRRGRDLMWSVDIIRTLGREPTYDTPSGVKGSGLDYYGNPVKKSAEGSSPEAKPESAPATKTAYSPDFENKEALIDYLERLKESTKDGLRFYAIGNTLAAQASQINKREKDLIAEGKEAGLKDALINWFNKNQNSENGLWNDKSDYLGVNGLLKISGVYSSCGVEIPYAEKGAVAAINAISSDEKMHATVDLYNTWFAISCILANLRKYGKETMVDGELLDGNARADRIIENLRKIAPPAIRKTKEKILDFKQADGGFSYCMTNPCPTSQGMPVCIPGLPESDVNATIIGSHELVGYIYSALGLSKYKVAMFGDCHFEKYISIIENNAKCK